MSPKVDSDIQSITSEVDISPNDFTSSKEKLSRQEVEALEKERFEHKKLIDQRDFWLLVGSALLYFVMYIIETACGNGEMSKIASTVSETMKFLISSLIGYLFANKS